MLILILQNSADFAPKYLGKISLGLIMPLLSYHHIHLVTFPFRLTILRQIAFPVILVDCHVKRATVFERNQSKCVQDVHILQGCSITVPTNMKSDKIAKM